MLVVKVERVEQGERALLQIRAQQIGECTHCLKLWLYSVHAFFIASNSTAVKIPVNP
jgi:hypothetical protein